MSLSTIYVNSKKINRGDSNNLEILGYIELM